MQLKSLAHGGLSLALILTAAAWLNGQPPMDKEAKKEPRKDVKPSVSINNLKAFKGYTLIAPMSSTKTHLIDMEGRVVHTWESDCTPALFPTLLDNGNLLRPGTLSKGGKFAPGAGGRVQEISWDGKLLWDYTFTGKDQHPHHDITRLPNGNVLMVVAERKNAKDVIAAGRRSEAGINADAIIEVRPTGKTTGEIVWEWHAWDHLIQDHDKSKANFGKISERPGRIDVNYGQGFGKMAGKDLDKLKGLGYFGGPGAKGAFNPGGDWTHVNAVAYNADLDQIMISVHSFSEVWIIDHSTSKSEAAGSTGGKYGKGGDILYRWGNPQAYRSGTNADQRLFNQHNAHWIPKGLPGAGNLLVFNNGGRRPDGTYSSVDEIVLPVNKDGSYDRKPGQPFGPRKAEWSYTAAAKSEFYSSFISGAHRLPNGNTLICSGANSTVFEVTPQKEVVWKFVNPGGGFGGPFKMPGGGFGFAIPRPGQIVPVAFEKALKIEPEQKKQIDELQKEVDLKLDKVLTDEQKKVWKKAREAAGGFPGFGPPPGGPPRPGQVLPASVAETLKLQAEQKKDIDGLQKDVDARLAKILTDEQKTEWKKLREGGAVKGKGPGGFGRGPGGLFRSLRIGTDHPALKGRDLTPGKKIEDL